MQEQKEAVKSVELIISEIAAQVQKDRSANGVHINTIKDYRWIFDQESSRMNQAIFNDQTDLIHESCLKTIATLIEILART